MSSSECQICYVKTVKYTIQCGSTVPHQMCFDCEREWRLKAKPTSLGRFITCPFCRTEEKEPGLRGRSSYEAELKLLYQQLYSQPRVRTARPARSTRPPSPPYVPDDDSDAEIPLGDLLRSHGRLAPRPAPVRRAPTTCQNVTMCRTRSTSRKCSYPGGCSANVCRTCKMCVSHFGIPVVPLV